MGPMFSTPHQLAACGRRSGACCTAAWRRLVFMLLQSFGLKEEPFGVSPDPRRLFLSQTHREALEALQSGFSSNRGFTAMIAPPGMGKTTLLFRFLEQIRDTARVVFLFDVDSTCEPREFVAYILRDLGIVPAQGS